jgi:hypothetical protein
MSVVVVQANDSVGGSPLSQPGSGRPARINDATRDTVLTDGEVLLGSWVG